MVTQRTLAKLGNKTRYGHIVSASSTIFDEDHNPLGGLVIKHGVMFAKVLLKSMQPIQDSSKRVSSRVMEIWFYVTAKITL